jgi:retron-type reverse transcriptase
MFLENEIKKFNHAYMPRVGTSTAIKDLVLNVLDKKYIYEFDIKGFFNNVDIDVVMECLRARGMPI